jgi:hypothetical protein
VKDFPKRLFPVILNFVAPGIQLHLNGNPVKGAFVDAMPDVVVTKKMIMEVVIRMKMIVIYVLNLNRSMKNPVKLKYSVLKKKLLVFGKAGLNGLNVITSVMVFSLEDNYVPVLMTLKPARILIAILYVWVPL